MNFKTDNFKLQKRSDIAPNEMANYDSYVREIKNRNGRTERDVIVVFDSAQSVIDHFMHNVEAVGGNGTWTNDETGLYYKSDMNDKDIWRYGTDFPTFNQTMECLTKGTTKDKYMQMFEKCVHDLYSKRPELYNLSATAVVKRRRRRISEDGDELEMDRYMLNDPAMWSSMPRQDSTKRCAVFYIDIGGSGGTDAKMLTASIINSLALVSIVERAGISTEVIVGRCNRNCCKGINLFTTACVAKTADQPLDVERVLSFALTGFFRCLTFATRINLSEGRQKEWGLGSGNWSYENKADAEYFDFFNAVVKTRCYDSYWTDGEMEMYIDGIKTFIDNI